MRALLKKKELARYVPHQIAVRKFTYREIKRDAISEGMDAVKKSWPTAKISLADIMQMDLNQTANNKKKNKNESGSLLEHNLIHKGQVLFVFKNAANAFCKKHGREPLF
jgi:hypothetical protein